MKITTSDLKKIISILYRKSFTGYPVKTENNFTIYKIDSESEQSNTYVAFTFYVDATTDALKSVDYVFCGIAGTWTFTDENCKKEPYPIAKFLLSVAKENATIEDYVQENLENNMLSAKIDTFLYKYDLKIDEETYTGREMTADEL